MDSDFDGIPDSIEDVAGTDSNDGTDAQGALDAILNGFSKAVPALGLPAALVMFAMMMGIAVITRPKNHSSRKP